MATLYNMTNVTNTTNPADMVIALHNVSGGMFGNVILLTGYFITLTSLGAFNNIDGFAATNYLWTTITLLFWAIGFASEYLLFVFVGLTTLSTSVLLYGNNDRF